MKKGVILARCACERMNDVYNNVYENKANDDSKAPTKSTINTYHSHRFLWFFVHFLVMDSRNHCMCMCGLLGRAGNQMQSINQREKNQHPLSKFCALFRFDYT